MEAEKEKAEREKAEEELRLKEQEKKKKKKTFRGAALALMVTNVSAAGFNFKSFSEKKKWLAEKRLWTRQIVSVIYLPLHHPPIFHCSMASLNAIQP